MKLTIYIQGLCTESKKQAFTDPKSAYALAGEALRLAQEYGLDKWRGFAMFHMAYACRVMSDYANGLILAFKALDIFEAIDDTEGLYRVRNIIGIIYFYYGAYGDAQEQFLIALELMKSLPDYNVEASVLNNLGEVYREAGNYTQALSYYEKAYKQSVDHGYIFNQAAILLNIGEVQHQMGDIILSVENFKTAYEIVLRENHILEQAESESKLGRAMMAMGNYDAARDYFITALEKFNRMKNKFYLVDLLIEMGTLDEVMGMNPTKNYLEALEIAQSANLEKKIGILYKKMSEHYEHLKIYEKALEFFKLYHNKLAEIEASNLSKRLEILSVEFDYYKHKTENNRFEQITEKLSREVSQTKKELESIKSSNLSLKYETYIDELTQVYNRRGIQNQLNLWFEEEPTFNGVVFLMDIDHFKQYNDRWGHIKGDQCLADIAMAIKMLPFENYFVGRYGGDEFIAFAKVRSFTEAEAIGEAIRSSKAVVWDDDKVTLSVGGWYGDIDKTNVWNCIDKADKQLYASKKEGRNKLRISDL